MSIANRVRAPGFSPPPSYYLTNRVGGRTPTQFRWFYPVCTRLTGWTGCRLNVQKAASWGRLAGTEFRVSRERTDNPAHRVQRKRNADLR